MMDVYENMRKALDEINKIRDNENIAVLSYGCFQILAKKELVERRTYFYSSGMVIRYFSCGTEIFILPQMPKDTFCIMTRKEYEDLKNEIIIE